MAHEASLQEKENLISNLECIIEEHEAKVAELQQAVDGEYVINEHEAKVAELQQAVDGNGNNHCDSVLWNNVCQLNCVIFLCAKKHAYKK